MTLPTLPKSVGNNTEALADALADLLKSVGTLEAKKIKSNVRFEWALSKKCYPETEIPTLRGVNYRLTGGKSEKNKTGRDSVMYIGKGRNEEERHPLYDRYKELYEQEKFSGKSVGRKPIQ